MTRALPAVVLAAALAAGCGARARERESEGQPMIVEPIAATEPAADSGATVPAAAPAVRTATFALG